jgi:hypothetical protein
VRVLNARLKEWDALLPSDRSIVCQVSVSETLPLVQAT